MSEGFAELKDVEIFSSGYWKGTEYSESDIENIPKNFPLGTVFPPLGIDHDEENEKALVKESGLPLSGSGLPALGTVSAVRTHKETCRQCLGKTKVFKDNDWIPCETCLGKGKQTILRADFKDVPGTIAKLIQAKAYNGVSAEIYDNPPEGVSGVGKTLRKVIFTGGDLPHIKTLKSLPFPTYTERKGNLQVINVKKSKGYFTVFSEVKPMTRDEMVGKLKGHGFNEETMKEFSDGGIAHIYETVEKAKHHSEGFTDDDLKKMPPEDAKKTYAEHCKSMMAAYTERGKKLFGDGWLAPGQEDGKKMDLPKNADMHSKVGVHTEGTMLTEEQTKKIVADATLAVIEAMKKEIEPAKKDIQSFKDTAKKDLVSSFVTQKRREGKVSAAELDRPNGRPNLIDRLMKADNIAAYHTFTDKDGKTTQQTELEVEFAILESRPVQRFSEQIGTNGQTTEDAEVSKVEAHYAAFSDSFKRLGVKKEEFVDAFKSKRKLFKDEYTAEEFLNVRK